MSLQAGRMAGVAKNLEKDPFIVTFVETRSTVAISYTGGGYGSSSFIDNVVQLSMKAGAAKIKIQYDASEYGSTNDGHLGIGVSGKAGAVNYWASYNNGTADGNNSSLTTSQSNMKLGGAMKFGKVKVSLNYTSMDKDGSSTTFPVNDATDSISLGANMGFGNGLSGNVGFATRSGDVAADDATFIRVAIMKMLNKGTSMNTGYNTTDYDVTGTASSYILGDGRVVRFDGLFIILILIYTDSLSYF